MLERVPRVEWFGVPRNGDARRLSRYFAAAGLVLLLAAPAVAAIDITIKPVPPPGLAEKANMFLGWLYYLAVLAGAGAIIGGLFGVYFGKDWGRQMIIAGLIGLALLASINTILHVI